jgi:arsenate reductase (thioredoxin)
MEVNGQMNQQPVILFVCEHGAAKSIVAATYFNQLAKEQNLNLSALARGTNPDAELSEPTVAGLSRDGLTPTDPAPEKLSITDTRAAQRIISFCELPAEYQDTTLVERWDDVPPVSEDYDKARDVIVQRIHDLLNRIRSSL